MLQRRCEGGIDLTDGDGMGGFIHGEDGNRMEERHRESETMDYEIHEPHDRMGTIVLDSEESNNIWRESTKVYSGEEMTTRNGESVPVCPKRGVPSTN